MSKHIFISYSRKNTEMMRQIDRALRMKGIKTWTDDQLTPGTSQWKAAIEKAIEQSAALVVLMSPDAKSSEWIDREVEYAKIHHIPIIPILISGDSMSAIPFELVTSQWVDMTEKSLYTQGLDKLTTTLLTLLGVKAKTKYQILHDELAQLAGKIPDLRWVGVISVEGLTMGFYSKTPSIEEDRVSAMSAATLSLSERLSSVLSIGNLQFVITQGTQGIVFNIGLGDDQVLMFALDQCKSLDSVVSSLGTWTKPLLEVLEG